MFQNITEDVVQEENEGCVKRRINLRRFFTVNDAVLYVIASMISMVSFNDQFMPFGLALFAAMCSNKRPLIISYFVIALGTTIGFGWQGLLVYLMTSAVFIGMIMLFKPRLQEGARNEKCNLGIYIFASTLIVQVVKMLFNTFLFYDIMVAVMLSILVYIFYKIFANSVGVIGDYGDKKAFSIEETIGASLLITIALIPFQNIKVWGLSFTNIFSIMLVLFLGWKNGVLTGGTAGITIGMVLGIISTGNPTVIAAYAISRNDCWATE